MFSFALTVTLILNPQNRTHDLLIVELKVKKLLTRLLKSLEIWTLITDIEDCSPYFPLGIGSPSLYINSTTNRKKLEPDTVSTELSPITYDQIIKVRFPIFLTIQC